MSEVPAANWTNNESQTHGGNAPVRFHAVQVPDNFQTKKQGRPIFRERIHMQMYFPGDQLCNLDRPATEEDKAAHPKEWEAFEQKKAFTVQGTPISLWPALSDTQKAEFRALNIFTVDQFAGMPDVHGMKIMGFHELRKKARAFIAACQQSELVDQMRGETDEKVRAQADRIAELERLVMRLAGPKPVKKKAWKAKAAKPMAVAAEPVPA